VSGDNLVIQLFNHLARLRILQNSLREGAEALRAGLFAPLGARF
jgi:hypothetical protein